MSTHVAAVLAFGLIFVLCLAAATLLYAGNDASQGTGGKDVTTQASCQACAHTGGMKDKVAKISTLTLATLINAGAPLTIVDARTGKFDDGRRIPGAKGLSPKASADQVTSVLPSKDALILTYCTNLKCGASHQLGTRLRELGYKYLLEYPEGIDGWQAAGQKVEKTKVTTAE